MSLGIGYDSLFEKLIHFLCRLNKMGRWKFISLTGASLARFFWPCDIDVNATIEGLHIPHATGIVIGYSAKIGKNVLIMPNVTIGSRFGAEQKVTRSLKTTFLSEQAPSFWDGSP